MNSQPHEIIGKIAMLLNPKDIVSMRLTNKELNWKVNKNHRLIPKPEVDVTLTVDDGLWVQVQLPAKGWKWVSILEEESAEGGGEMTPEREEEQRSMLSAFYGTRRAKFEKKTAGFFSWGRRRAVLLHFVFILSHMKIRKLCLNFNYTTDDIDEEEYCNTIAHLIGDFGAKVDELRFKWTTYHLPLIEAAQPRSLVLEIRQLYYNLYESPTVRKLEKFVMNGPQTCDSQLLVLTAEILELTHPGIFYDRWITIPGLRQFLQQWIERKREISYVLLGSEGDQLGSEEEWASMMGDWDPSLAVVTSHNGVSWTLRRTSDGAAILLHFVTSRIKMETFDYVF